MADARERMFQVVVGQLRGGTVEAAQPVLALGRQALRAWANKRSPHSLNALLLAGSCTARPAAMAV